MYGTVPWYCNQIIITLESMKVPILFINISENKEKESVPIIIEQILKRQRDAEIDSKKFLMKERDLKYYINEYLIEQIEKINYEICKKSLMKTKFLPEISFLILTHHYY